MYETGLSVLGDRVYETGPSVSGCMRPDQVCWGTGCMRPDVRLPTCMSWPMHSSSLHENENN